MLDRSLIEGGSNMHTTSIGPQKKFEDLKDFLEGVQQLARSPRELVKVGLAPTFEVIQVYIDGQLKAVVVVSNLE